MFDVDLLNTSGLQKIIYRHKVENHSTKGSITFEKPIINEDVDNDSYDEDNADDGKNGLLSYVVAVILFLSLTIFAFIDYQEMFSVNTSNDLVISSLIRLVNNPETKGMISSITIHEDVEVYFFIDNLDRINQIKSALQEDSYEYKVYEIDKDNYAVEAINRVAFFKENDNKINSFLNSISDRYDEVNMMVDRDLRCARFISNNKNIFGILEELINLGTIKISPHGDSNSDFIALKFYY